MKVYVITKGEYSDYHICCVVDNKAKAELVKEKLTDKWEEPYIEEYDTDDVQVNAYLDKNNTEYCVSLDAETGLIECNAGREFIYTNEISNSEVWETSAQGRLVHYHTFVYAENEEKATKIAADRFAKYKAEKAGL